MPKYITVTLENSQQHVYQNAPDDITPAIVQMRAEKEFGSRVVGIDGGKHSPGQALGSAPQNVPLTDGSYNTAPTPGGYYADNAQPIDARLQQQYDETSAPKAFAVGMGKAFTDIGTGVSQLGAYALKTATPSSSQLHQDASQYLNNSIQQAAADESLYQRATPNGFAAGLGRLTGNMAATALPSGAATNATVKALSEAAPVVQMLAGGAAGGAVTGAAQPVETGSADNFGTTKALQTVAGSATGAAVPAAITLAGKGAALVTSPKQTLANFWNGQKVKADPLFYNESLRLQNETGVQMTPAMKTGSRWATGSENAARQSYFTADDMKAVDRRIADQAGAYIEKVMNGVSPSSENAATVGAAVKGALDKGVKAMIDSRDAVAAKEYGAIRQNYGGTVTNQVEVPSKILGANGSPLTTSKSVESPAFTVKPDGLVSTLRNIIAQHDNVPAGEAKAIVAKAQSLLSGITDKNGQPLPMSINDALKARSYYSKAAAGTGSVFEDINPTDNQKFARELWNGIESDFDNVANNAGGKLGEQLKQANANYRAASLQIEQAKGGVIGRILGKDIVKDGVDISQIPPESIAAKVVALKPTEAKFIKGFIDQYSPSTSLQVGRHIIQSAWEKAQETPISAGADPLPQFNVFNRLIAKNEALKDWITPEQFGQIKNAQAVIRRMGDKFGFNFSGTSAQSAFDQVLQAFGSGPRAVLGAISAIAGMKGIAKGAATGETYVPTIAPGPVSKALSSPIAKENLGRAAAVVSGKAVGKPNSRDKNNSTK